MNTTELKDLVNYYINSGYSLSKLFNYTFSDFGEHLIIHTTPQECPVCKPIKNTDCEFWNFYEEFCDIYKIWKNTGDGEIVFVELKKLCKEI
jgi:hypothetical protein